jgi:Tol biopolymer transport system component
MRLPQVVARLGVAGCLTLSLGLAAVPPGADASTDGDTASARNVGAAPSDGRIVFSDFQTGQVYTVNPDGSALVQVTHLNPGQFATQPQWGPEGRRIVFAANLRGSFRLYVVSASGAHMRRVAFDGHGYDNFTPTFSNNGRRILYTRCRPDPPGGCAIYSIRADGTGRRPLTHYRERIREGEDFFPAVSPNGRSIAFTRFDTGGVLAQVWVMRSDGARAHSITPVRLEAGQPRWTADGRHLLIVNNAAHLGDSVYRVRPDGSRLHLLTTPRWPNNDLFPAPSSRGDRIAFASDRTHRDLCCVELYVMRSNGGGEHMVKTGQHGVVFPDWGSAPLLPASAATPDADLAPPLTGRQALAAKAAMLQLGRWIGDRTR